VQSMGSQPVRPPLQNNRGQPVQQPNPYQPTYGNWRSVRLECRPIPLTR
jgi:hypothetical protein